MALDQSKVKHASSFKEQFTVRAIVIGIIGSVILTCSSMFVALKASSLPWPIMFVALVSMFALKALGNTNVNEINVAHTCMSAGSMVAGGLAFTIPGIFILNNNAEFSVAKVMIVTVGGTILGLIFTSLIRKHFVVDADMPYAMGQAAADMPYQAVRKLYKLGRKITVVHDRSHQNIERDRQYGKRIHTTEHLGNQL